MLNIFKDKHFEQSHSLLWRDLSKEVRIEKVVRESYLPWSEEMPFLQGLYEQE